jgi:mevalonate kinase
MIDEIIRLLINVRVNKAILTINDKKLGEFVIINDGLHSNINVKTGEIKDLFLHILSENAIGTKMHFKKASRQIQRFQ